MKRRLILSVPPLAAAAAFVTSLTGRGRRASSFYIAGVRFHPIRGALGLGERLHLVKRTGGAHAGLSIVRTSGEPVGWVPAGLVSALANRNISEVHVVGVNPHAVPWRRYRVAASA